MITVFVLLQIPRYCSVEHHQPDDSCVAAVVWRAGGVKKGTYDSFHFSLLSDSELQTLIQRLCSTHAHCAAP